MVSPKPRAPRESLADYNARMRREGLRPIVIWVPDSSAQEFHDAARRQSRLIAESPEDDEDLAFVESLADELFNDLDAEEL